MTELVRYEAARRALAEAVAVDEVAEIRSKAEALRHYARQAGDKTLEIQSAQLRFRAERKMGELLAAAKEAGHISRGQPPKCAEKNCSDSEQFSEEPISRVTLEQAGIDRKLSSRAQKLAAMDLAEFEQALARHKAEMESGAGRVAMDLLKVDAEERGRVHRRDLAAALSSASAVAPDGRLYPALLADPPWRRKAGIGDRAYENHYPTMPWPEILDYLKRAGEALLPDSWAWMWVPRAHLLAKVPFKTEVVLADGEVVLATIDLPLAYACQLALGMDAYSTCYVWTKTDEEHPDVSGTGLLVWDQDELLLQFKRGRGLPKPASDEKFGSNHRERATDHSRKPEHYRNMIRAMVGCDSEGEPLPVLELFARVDAEHPLPKNWGAWGNQAGVSAQGAEISTPTDAGESPSSAGASDARPARQTERLWEHPAIQGRHAVTMTREYPDDEILSVATCQCGWSFRADAMADGAALRHDPVDEHWRDVIAQHESALAAELPAGEGGVAVADASSERASPAVSATVDRAPYDAADVVTIDQLAGSEWLAPADLDALELPEREQLKILSDFCHPKRALCDVLGPHWLAREMAYQASGQWALRGKGWDRLRELDAAEAKPAAPAPKAVLTEPYRAPQPTLFDVARQLDDAPAPELVDGALQTRLPVDDDELAEQLALLDIGAGRAIEPEMLRHLVGKGFAHCGLTKVLVTDDGRAFLAQLVSPASVQQQGAEA
ncbi:hypothetical protein E4K66_30885 [Bradyrhizobium frederickii]|uniref:Uncharacterized protein n=1 Tax=Bradyrhizobium frederickii TaxID=2560054 RepID=A0A4Y9KY30_9BRAD|nr:hypothetical protein [Bradyrhizobium frederickii]TFV34572.1 hypothetical protein E4K66_30885 [Bradyrhizobium frederickii]